VIIANLIGGLGNQMFQYATSRALARDLDQALRFSADGFRSYSLHQGLQLASVFALDLPLASRADLQRTVGRLLAPNLMRRLAARVGWPGLASSRFVAEPSPRWWPELRQRCLRGAYLHGYWHSEHYFAHQAEAIRADFRWREPLQGRNADLARQILDAPRAISLHVRRGDYVANAKNQSIYASCPPSYYVAALERIAQRTGLPATAVFAFSDDPGWVMQELAPHIPGLVLVDHNRAAASWQDMRLMSLCRHHIIANSSFSWWGAWLDGRAGAEVIAPAHWYANSFDDSDLVPSGWHRL